jgi:hypothetical protein
VTFIFIFFISHAALKLFWRVLEAKHLFFRRKNLITKWIKVNFHCDLMCYINGRNLSFTKSFLCSQFSHLFQTFVQRYSYFAMNIL